MAEPIIETRSIPLRKGVFDKVNALRTEKGITWNDLFTMAYVTMSHSDKESIKSMIINTKESD